MLVTVMAAISPGVRGPGAMRAQANSPVPAAHSAAATAAGRGLRSAAAPSATAALPTTAR